MKNTTAISQNFSFGFISPILASSMSLNSSSLGIQDVAHAIYCHFREYIHHYDLLNWIIKCTLNKRT